MTAVDKAGIQVREPEGRETTCTVCNNKAVVSIKVWPIQEHANVVFLWLCSIHSNYMITSLVPLSQDHGTHGWEYV